MAWVRVDPQDATGDFPVGTILAFFPALP